MPELLMTLAVSLLLTEAFESLTALPLGFRSFHDMSLLWLVNVVTNPPVVLSYILLSRAISAPPLLLQLPLEFAVVFVEWQLFKRFGRDIKRPLLCAIVVNAVSYGLGLLINLI